MKHQDVPGNAVSPQDTHVNKTDHGPVLMQLTFSGRKEETRGSRLWGSPQSERIVRSSQGKRELAHYP